MFDVNWLATWEMLGHSFTFTGHAEYISGVTNELGNDDLRLDPGAAAADAGCGPGAGRRRRPAHERDRIPVLAQQAGDRRDGKRGPVPRRVATLRSGSVFPARSRRLGRSLLAGSLLAAVAVVSGDPVRLSAQTPEQRYTDWARPGLPSAGVRVSPQPDHRWPTRLGGRPPPRPFLGWPHARGDVPATRGLLVSDGSGSRPVDAGPGRGAGSLNPLHAAAGSAFREPRAAETTSRAVRCWTTIQLRGFGGADVYRDVAELDRFLRERLGAGALLRVNAGASGPVPDPGRAADRESRPHGLSHPAFAGRLSRGRDRQRLRHHRPSPHGEDARGDHAHATRGRRDDGRDPGRRRSRAAGGRRAHPAGRVRARLP